MHDKYIKQPNNTQAKPTRDLRNSKHAGMSQRTNIKVGNALGDFWTKLKNLAPS
ncbi:MAG: hypothetical protein Q9M22_04295 [Mariprofundaceae bacterium]|nr:hypothetical protein [Mariprofundaceae bacterium]